MTDTTFSPLVDDGCPIHGGQGDDAVLDLQGQYHCDHCTAIAHTPASRRLLPRIRPVTEVAHLDHISSAFGHERVSPFVRQARIRSLFQSIAERYDLMNDLLSGFMHRAWKRKFVKGITAKTDGMMVDVAGGTGDIAALLAERFVDRDVMILDPSTEMLSVARKRLGDRCDYLSAQAECCPIANETVSTATLSFGLRNFTHPTEALREIRRVLKPGGRLYILEFSRPDGCIAPIYRAYARLAIPIIGALVTRNRGAYRYLVDSISSFPSLATVSDAIKDADLDFVHCEKLMFGIAAIHVAEKPSIDKS